MDTSPQSVPGDTLPIYSRSLDDTATIAAAFARVLKGGEIISLEGDLGAGKTAFTRALAHALGVKETVNSPTFVLQKIYEVPGGPVRSLVHYDLYRINSYEELADIGFEEIAEDAVVVAEWGNRFSAQFPREPVKIAIIEIEEGVRRFDVKLATRAEAEQFMGNLLPLIIPSNMEFDK